MKKFIGVCALTIGGVYLLEQRPAIKTYIRINRKIEFIPPTGFQSNIEFEKSIADVIIRQRPGVHVIALPKNFGTTTSLKHVASKIQDGEIKQNPNNWQISQGEEEKVKNKNINVVYIDGNEIKKEELKDEKWFFNQFGQGESGKYYHYPNTFPKDTRTLIILDHMSRDIVDGFAHYLSEEDSTASAFFAGLAISSYNDAKFTIIVSTENPAYAKDITSKCNGGAKLELMSWFNQSKNWWPTEKHDNFPSKEEFDRILKESDRWEK